MTEKPKLEVVESTPLPTPNDASDIEALWSDPALGDGLTDTSWHKIPVGQAERLFPGPSRIPTTDVVPRSMPTSPKARSKRRTTFWGPKCGGGCRKPAPAFSSLAFTATARCGLWPTHVSRARAKRTTPPGRAPGLPRGPLSSKWVSLIWSGRSYLTRDALPGYAPDPGLDEVASVQRVGESRVRPARRDPRHRSTRSIAS